MTTFEHTNSNETSNSVDKLSDSLSPMLLTLKIVEYLFLAAFVCAVVITNNFPQIQVAKIYIAAFLAIWLFFFLANRQILENYKHTDIAKKAEVYTYLLGRNYLGKNNLITGARAKALQYSQQLIDDYKKTRSNSRNIYYIAQLATVILSGVTPILVLVDKLEADSQWLKWLPVICPALASIVASIVTSFPFQENSIAANTAVELLEAEQEKFILGVTPPYRCYDLVNETQRQQQSQKAIENFIEQVNSIHLKQVRESGQTKSGQEKTEPAQSVELKQGQS